MLALTQDGCVVPNRRLLCLAPGRTTKFTHGLSSSRHSAVHAALTTHKHHIRKVNHQTALSVPLAQWRRLTSTHQTWTPGRQSCTSAFHWPQERTEDIEVSRRPAAATPRNESCQRSDAGNAGHDSGEIEGENTKRRKQQQNLWRAAPP